MSRVTSSSSSSSAAITDTSGNALTSTSGSLNVNITGDASTSTYSLASNYNEITNVTNNTETTIVSYSAISGTSCYLQLVQMGGQNIAEYHVYRNASIIDKQYTYFTQYNAQSDYRTDNSNIPGILLADGDVVYVKVVNVSPGLTTSNFNGRIQVLQVAS